MSPPPAGPGPTLPYTFPTDAELAGRRVLVMGLGLFHGGASVIRFLVGRGAEVTVTDLRDEVVLAPTLEELAGVPFEPVLGRHRREDFERTDLVVVNPGVPADSEYLAAALGRGVPLTSEVGLCLSRLRSRLAFVTGSKGKTTTASLLHCMLIGAGLVAELGGNIGRSLLERVDGLNERETVVFEASSFQLEQLRGLELAPEVAVITNLFPVHLDRHGTFEAYCEAKRIVLRGARSVVLNFGDPSVRALADQVDGPVSWFSGAAAPPAGYVADARVVREVGGGAVVTLANLKIPGAHNLLNVMAALAAARLLGARQEPAVDAAREFPGVEHRLEQVGERAGIHIVNDSIATTPRSTMAALAALEGPLILIAGGQDTGLELAELAVAIGERVKLLVAVGESGPRLESQVVAAAPTLAVRGADDFAAAVAVAFAAAEPGDTVLLSPAFPSFDLFRNFRERGDVFKRLAID